MTFFKTIKSPTGRTLNLIILVLMFLVQGEVLAEANTTFSVSGNVILPKAASAEGTVIKLKFYNFYNYNIQFEKDIDIAFSQGDVTKPYTIDLPNGDLWIRSYTCLSGCDSYYNSQSSDDLPSTGDQNNINFNVIEAVTIRGEFVLPQALVSTDPNFKLKIELSLETKDRYSSSIAEKEIVISLGESRASFVFKITKSWADAGQMIMHYRCLVDCSNLHFISEGYYNESGTVFSENDASVLATTASFDFNILEPSSLPQKLISGNVTLPQSAPDEGTVLKVNIFDSIKGSFSTIVQFEKNEITKPYSIQIPNLGEYWYRRIDCLSGCGFVYEGDKKFINFGNEDQTTHNLDISEAVNISGEIVLPQVLSDSNINNLRILLELRTKHRPDFYNDHPEYDKIVDFSTGEKNKPFTFKIKKDDSQELKLNYRCDTNYFVTSNIDCTNLGLVQSGYYNDQGTFVDINKAQIFNANTSSIGLQFNILGMTSLPRYTVSGNVNLPKPAPSGGASIDVTISGASDSSTKIVHFLEGETSQAYSMTLISYPTTTMSYRYTCETGCYNYVSVSYYSDTFLGGADKTDVDLNIIEALHISGTFVLPRPLTPPDPDFNTLEVLVELNGTDRSTSKLLRFSYGDSNKTFDLKFKKDPLLQLTLAYRDVYIVGGRQGGLGMSVKYRGFYNEQGSIETKENATILSGEHSTSGLVFNIISSSTINDTALDIDGDGKIEPLTDGLLNLRYQFGFRGDTLINDAVAADASRKTADEIESYLIEAGLIWDIDGDHIIDPLTDGLLTMRYMFDFRGDTLTNDAVGENAIRTQAVDIEAYLNSHAPQ